MSNPSDFQTQRNKVFARTAETVATKTVLLGAEIVKAIVAFLKEMLHSFLGK
jgi:hypothetical protein